MSDSERITPTPEEQEEQVPSADPAARPGSAEAPASQPTSQPTSTEVYEPMSVTAPMEVPAPMQAAPTEASDQPGTEPSVQPETASGETAPETAASPASPAASAETAADQTSAQTLYRWTYAGQAEHERKEAEGKHRKGILTYAIIMTAVFIASLGLLVAVLLMDGGGSAGSSILRPGISDPSNDDEAVAGVEQAKHSVVVIEVTTPAGGGTGTGIIMTENGYIATNHHVIEDATKVKVTFYDGSTAYAEVIGSSEMDDLAVIKVSLTGLRAAVFAHSDECYVGQTVYAIGTPAGPDFGWTTTKGIISYKDREVKIYDDDGTLQKKLRLLQTDANVNPGNSGGPLINVKGEVVGVVSMKLADGYEGIGFAIPSDGAVEILEAIKQYGHANDINSSLSHKRPMLGITGVYVDGNTYYLVNEDGIQMIPEEELDQYEGREIIHPAVSGVYVMGFAEGMDAAAKMQAGDIITAAEGEEIISMSMLSNIINGFYAGDTVTLTVYRNSLYTDVDIVLSAQPD